MHKLTGKNESIQQQIYLQITCKVFLFILAMCRIFPKDFSVNMMGDKIFVLGKNLVRCVSANATVEDIHLMCLKLQLYIAFRHRPVLTGVT